MGLIELRGVTVERGGRTLIADVDMTLAPGRMTVLIGPNGAGKSTALKVASGVWPATKGAAALDGQDIARMKPRELAERRALVAQGASLGFPFTVGEVVMLGATVPGFGLDSSPEIATGALASVGLTGFEARNYLELSGGERQRVHIARALCQLRAARRHGEHRPSHAPRRADRQPRSGTADDGYGIMPVPGVGWAYGGAGPARSQSRRGLGGHACRSRQRPGACYRFAK